MIAVTTKDVEKQNSSNFNAFCKKLGLYEKQVHQEYIGTIFTS